MVWVIMGWVSFNVVDNGSTSLNDVIDFVVTLGTQFLSFLFSLILTLLLHCMLMYHLFHFFANE